ncbi:MAG TPA: hypothetical protein VN611_02815 [Patescibacteria group bacterium]|nr:hypothetical protein [Patescibacteria group bacterium]
MAGDFSVTSGVEVLMMAFLFGTFFLCRVCCLIAGFHENTRS